MNREQAIKELTDLLPEEFLSEYAEAIRMGIKALEQEPCEDCISRKQAIELFVCWWSDLLEHQKEDECFDALLKTLPPVTPQPNMGWWITLKDEYGDVAEAVCSCCDKNGNHKWAFCPNCGAKMQEVRNDK